MSAPDPADLSFLLQRFGPDKPLTEAERQYLAQAAECDHPLVGHEVTVGPGGQCFLRQKQSWEQSVEVDKDYEAMISLANCLNRIGDYRWNIAAQVTAALAIRLSLLRHGPQHTSALSAARALSTSLSNEAPSKARLGEWMANRR